MDLFDPKFIKGITIREELALFGSQIKTPHKNLLTNNDNVSNWCPKTNQGYMGATKSCCQPDKIPLKMMTSLRTVSMAHLVPKSIRE